MSEKRIIQHRKKGVKIKWRKKRKVIVNRVTQGTNKVLGRNTKTLWRKAVRTAYKKKEVGNGRTTAEDSKPHAEVKNEDCLTKDRMRGQPLEVSAGDSGGQRSEKVIGR